MTCCAVNDGGSNRAYDHHGGHPGFDEELQRAVRFACGERRTDPSVHGGKARPKSASLII